MRKRVAWPDAAVEVCEPRPGLRDRIGRHPADYLPRRHGRGNGVVWRNWLSQRALRQRAKDKYQGNEQSQLHETTRRIKSGLIAGRSVSVAVCEVQRKIF